MFGMKSTKTIEKHPYIGLIEYAMDKKEFSIGDTCRATGLSRQEFMFARGDLFILSAAQKDVVISDTLVLAWKLNPQALFNYIQYQSFQHAVESSHRAEKLSQLALGISAVSAIAGLLGSIAVLI